MNVTRRALAALPFGLAAPAIVSPAWAQSAFPNAPIRLICPWGAGGTTDVQMRALADQVSRRIGQPVVIENRAGAGGVLGAQALLSARPDGYTLSQMPISVFRQPLLNSRALFDPLTDFTYVSHISGYLFGTVVRPDAPWNSMQELVAYARANPGKLTYGTPGVGSSLHLTMELIAQRAGIEWVHVPFRGYAENAQALLGRQIDIVADSSGWAPAVMDGQMKLLATWGAERAKRFPNAPTLKESGIDVVSASPYGLAGPKGMDPAVVRTLDQAFRAATLDPKHIEILDRYDMAPMPMNADEYTSFVRRTMDEERALIQRLGLRLS